MGLIVYGAMTVYVQQGALADQLRQSFERVWLKGVSAPAGSSAQYQVMVFNVHVHSANTAWETVWKTCHVAFRDYGNKTTRRFWVTTNFKVCITFIYWLLPPPREEVMWQLFLNKINSRSLDEIPWKCWAKGDVIMFWWCWSFRIFDHKIRFYVI